MLVITREQAAGWRQAGRTYDEMAKESGLCVSTIQRYMKKYGMTGRRLVTDEEKDGFRRMAAGGMEIKEIADQSGYAYSTVYKALKAAGLAKKKRGGGTAREAPEEGEMPELPRYTMAVSGKRPPFPVEIRGRRYQDVTYLYFPL